MVIYENKFIKANNIINLNSIIKNIYLIYCTD